MTIVPLTTILAPGADTGKRFNTDPDDLNWYQFVLDHQSEILKRSTPMDIGVDAYNEVAYDLRRWYRSKRMSLQYLWVTRLINPRVNDIEFTDTYLIYIPNSTYMRELYERYSAGIKPIKREAP